MESMKTTDIFLSVDEARCGCRRMVSLPKQTAPLNLTLRPGIRDNTKLIVNNAWFYDRGGRVARIPVKVTVHVAENVNPVGRKKKSGHWVLKMFALLLLIGIGISLSSPEDKGNALSNPDAADLSDIFRDAFAGGNGVSGTLPAAPSGGGQTAAGNKGSSGAVSPDARTGTDIPAVLLQEGWKNFGSPEYCPKVEFFPEGKFRMWINLGDDYCSFDATYEVYQYSDGSRTISCDISSLSLEDCTWKRLYLVESAGGGWKYQGASIGFTDSSCSFVKADSGTVYASVTSVQTPGVTAGSHWATDGVCDELTINWRDFGKVNFDLDVYRMWTFEDQTGFCAPDGAVYCCLSTDTGHPEGLVRITFQKQNVSLEFLTAGGPGESILGNYYVGQTYIFR